VTPPACDPHWPAPPKTDPDRPPDPGHLRVQEIHDQTGQHAPTIALWTATTINPPKEYL
jgi:hypothetical protein